MLGLKLNHVSKKGPRLNVLQMSSTLILILCDSFHSLHIDFLTEQLLISGILMKLGAEFDHIHIFDALSIC